MTLGTDGASGFPCGAGDFASQAIRRKIDRTDEDKNFPIPIKPSIRDEKNYSSFR
jgi:hypothetical protein